MKQGGCNSKGTFIKKSGGKKGPCSQDTFFSKKVTLIQERKSCGKGEKLF